MKRALLLLLLGPSLSLLSQNLDLVPFTTADAFRSAVGSGMSVSAGPLSIAMNPAAFAVARNFSMEAWTSYRTENVTLSLQTPSLPSADVDDQRKLFVLDGVSAGLRLGESIRIGAAVLRRFEPSVHSARRAITRSILFTHDTDGSVWEFALGPSVDVGKDLTVGAAFFLLNGSVSSRLQGDNHGADANQWAELRSACSGVGANVGLLWRLGGFSAGLAVESPVAVAVRADKKISADSAYAARFPTYDQTTWRMPATLRAGLSYGMPRGSRVSVGIEAREFSPSDVQFALYEYGGDPVWGRVVNATIGVELHPGWGDDTPLWLGVARLPQVYASSRATGTNVGNVLQVTNVVPTSRTIRMVYSAGTMLQFLRVPMRAGVAYSTLRWHRTVIGTAAEEQDYDESVVTIFVGVVI